MFAGNLFSENKKWVGPTRTIHALFQPVWSAGRMGVACWASLFFILKNAL
jgi:hypothetical protein